MDTLCCVNFEAGGGVLYLHFSEVRDYVVVETSLVKIHIGIAIIFFLSFYVFVLVDECSTGIVIYNF
jgi:hypothetical protein